MSTKLTLSEIANALMISIFMFIFILGIASLPIYEAPLSFSGNVVLSTVCAVVAFIYFLKQTKNKKVLDDKISHLSDFDKIKLQMLGFIAMADDELQDSEIAEIEAVYKENSHGKTVSTQDIKDVVKLVIGSHTSAETFVKDVKDSISKEERKQLIRLGHQFITRDGKAEKKDKKVLKEIASYFFVNLEEIEKELEPAN